jgi:hypothetical protein
LFYSYIYCSFPINLRHGDSTKYLEVICKSEPKERRGDRNDQLFVIDCFFPADGTIAEIDVVFDGIMWEDIFPSSTAYVQFGKVAGCRNSVVAAVVAGGVEMIDDEPNTSSTEEEEEGGDDDDMDSDLDDGKNVCGAVTRSPLPRICFLAGTLYLQDRF